MRHAPCACQFSNVRDQPFSPWSSLPGAPSKTPNQFPLRGRLQTWSYTDGDEDVTLNNELSMLWKTQPVSSSLRLGFFQTQGSCRSEAILCNSLYSARIHIYRYMATCINCICVYIYISCINCPRTCTMILRCTLLFGVLIKYSKAPK